MACCNGYLEIAKWLYSLDNKLNIRIDNDRAFKFVCKCDYIYIAEWLVSICCNYKILIDTEEDKIIGWKIDNKYYTFYE
jgi:hypothetical protein